MKLKDTSNNKLEEILTRLIKNNIPCKMLKKDGRIVELDTQDKEMLKLAKELNPDLK